MASHDPRIDAYIERAAPFAQDLLRHWRATVHAHCPDVVETIKWGFPNFVYRNKILSGMAAFKAHCSIGFWHGEAALGEGKGKDGAMGDYGRLTSLKDLPPKSEQKAAILRAMKLIEGGVKARPAEKSTPKPPPEAPADLIAAWIATPPRARPSTASRPASAATTSIGSSRPRSPRRASAASRRRSSGWPRASAGTGSTRTAEGARRRLRRGAARSAPRRSRGSMTASGVASALAAESS
ncbi:hypothetical protein Ddc_21059 [Ditylenchus destructor]|nr:hypothetical protein Ddc_21059 [Ditylenchus destructor]